MAVLTTEQRVATRVKFTNVLNSAREEISIERADLQAAIDAADDWADAAASNYNASLPLPARTSLTARQKAAILMYVIAKRFEGV